MAKSLKQHKAVGADYLAADSTPPHVVQRLAVPPELVWAALLDAKAWSQWLPIDEVVWTSPEPFGVGTTRTVTAAGQTIEETFYAWEDGHRMAFRFEKTSLPVSAGAEDYRVVEAHGGCELRWWGKASGVPFGWLVGRQLKSGIASGAPKLETLIKANPARFGG